MSNRILILRTALALILITSVTFVACKKLSKDEIGGNPALQTMLSPAGNDFVFGPNNPTTGYTYTLLGRQYASVFNVTNVKNAWNALSSNPISALDPTHLYVKFTPNDLEELKQLVDMNIPLYTFPLDYEIIQYGDFMQDPALEPHQIPPFFSCVIFGQDIPLSSYTIWALLPILYRA